VRVLQACLTPGIMTEEEQWTGRTTCAHRP
jgi:hypothetical protein